MRTDVVAATIQINPIENKTFMFTKKNKKGIRKNDRKRKKQMKSVIYIDKLKMFSLTKLKCSILRTIKDLTGNDHLIKFHLTFSLDRIFWSNALKLVSWLKNSINCQKITCKFWQLIKTFNNVIFSYFKILINCQKEPTDFGSWSKLFKLIELVLMANF